MRIKPQEILVLNQSYCNRMEESLKANFLTIVKCLLRETENIMKL